MGLILTIDGVLVNNLDADTKCRRHTRTCAAPSVAGSLEVSGLMKERQREERGGPRSVWGHVVAVLIASNLVD